MKKIVLVLALFVSAVCMGKENPNMEAVWFLCEQYKEVTPYKEYPHIKKINMESCQKIGMVYVAGIDPELLKAVRSKEGRWDIYTEIGYCIYRLYEIKHYESLTDYNIQEAAERQGRIKDYLGMIRHQYEQLQERERKKAPDYQEKLRKQLNDIEL